MRKHLLVLVATAEVMAGTLAVGGGTPAGATATGTPGAPTNVVATPGDHQLSVTWTPPADPGTSPITSYAATASDITSPGVNGDGNQCTYTVPTDGSSESDTCAVTGLAAGDSYTVSVTALNQSGSGLASSASSSATPITPASDFFGSLEGVSCPAVSYCVAVGLDFTTLDGVAELWNGSEWFDITNRVSMNGKQLMAVSCASSSFCVAAASLNLYSGQRTTSVFLEWNGRSWSEMPASAAVVDIWGVFFISCTSTLFCMAGSPTTLYTWDGAGWTSAAAPWSEAGASGEGATAISCASATFCMAVGANAPQPPGCITLCSMPPASWAWNGSVWNEVPTTALPADLGIVNATPSSVSCVEPTYCMMVGTVTELWDGSVWNYEPDAAAEAGLKSWQSGVGIQDALASVSCPEVGSCTAVGFQTPPPGPLPMDTLVQRWDGSQWTQIPSPSPSPVVNVLEGVSCVDAIDCQMVGVRWNPPTQAAHRHSEIGPVGRQSVTTLLQAIPSEVLRNAGTSNPKRPLRLTEVAGVIVGSPVPSSPLTIVTTSLPSGSVYSKSNKTVYSTTLVAAAGNAPYKWTLASGPGLPPGLKLKPTGVISGKAKSAGTYTFTVRVADTKTKGKPPVQHTATATFTITIS